MESELHEFYEHYDEDSRLLSRAGNVEFSTTMHFIEKYLRPGMRILEVGAATGRYSHTLARMGYRVDAVEPVRHNIDIFNRLTQSSATNSPPWSSAAPGCGPRCSRRCSGAKISPPSSASP